MNGLSRGLFSWAHVPLALGKASEGGRGDAGTLGIGGAPNSVGCRESALAGAQGGFPGMASRGWAVSRGVTGGDGGAPAWEPGPGSAPR